MDSPGQDRLAALAVAIVERRLGSPPSACERATTGLSNQVFLVTHDAGGFVVRLGEEAKAVIYAKEQWAMERARAVGVPTVEVVEVGVDPSGTAFMLAKRAPGRPATDHPRRAGILGDLGALAARLHAIRGEAFGGVFDPECRTLGTHPSWGAFVLAELELERRLAVLTEHDMLPERRLGRLREILLAGADQPPALNHGDLRLKNVLVDDDGRITALIDWETCTFSLAPQWDLSLALHDLSIDAKEAFLAGYGIDEDGLDAIAGLVKALNVLNYAPEIERLAAADEVAEIERHRARLGGALDLYSF